MQSAASQGMLLRGRGALPVIRCPPAMIGSGSGSFVGPVDPMAARGRIANERIYFYIVALIAGEAEHEDGVAAVAPNHT